MVGRRRSVRLGRRLQDKSGSDDLFTTKKSLDKHEIDHFRNESVSGSDSESESEILKLAQNALSLSLSRVRHKHYRASESDTSSSDDENNSDSEGSGASKGAKPAFVVDKSGGYAGGSGVTRGPTEFGRGGEESDKSEDETEPVPVISRTGKSSHKKQHEKDHMLSDNRFELASSLQPGVAELDTYLNTDAYFEPQLKNAKINELLLRPSNDLEVMKKSVLGPDLEKKDSLPPYDESLGQLKKQRKKQRDTTKGKGWYDLPATELTEERKNDLMVIQMRRALDPKRFYKAPDLKTLPKYFETGTVVEHAADFYHSRVPRKQRKATIVDELMADTNFKEFAKRKHKEIEETSSSKRRRGAVKHMKRMKKSKK